MSSEVKKWILLVIGLLLCVAPIASLNQLLDIVGDGR